MLQTCQQATPTIVAMGDQVWEYSRDRLRPGLSYPVGQTQVRQILHEANIDTNVSLRCPGRDAWHSSHSGPLIVADWHASLSSSVFLKRGTAPGARTWLNVYAVPSEIRASTAELVMNGLLLDACVWIKSATARPDSAWAGSRHRWSAHLRHGTLSIDEM